MKRQPDRGAAAKSPVAFETLVGVGAEAEQFRSAFFRYIETKSAGDEDDLIVVRTEPHGWYERKTVTLWSVAATLQFAHYWRECRQAARRSQDSTPTRQRFEERQPLAGQG